jgi:hypothetical protein
MTERRLLATSLCAVLVWVSIFTSVLAEGPPDAAEPFSHRLLRLDGAVVKWGAPRHQSTARVTWALETRSRRVPDARNCRAMAPFTRLARVTGLDRIAIEGELTAAFEAWSRVANISFRRIADPEAADIVVGTQAKERGWAFANVKPSSAGARSIMFRAAKPKYDSFRVSTIEKSSICLNASRPWKIGYDGDLSRYDLRHTFTHEIGHAIGLDHPRRPDQLMHYRYRERLPLLRAGDIEGAVRLYGLPVDQRASFGGRLAQ